MSVLTAGWRTAVFRAVLAVVVLGALGEAIAFLIYATADEPRPSWVVFAKVGGALFYGFHHVGFVFHVPRSVLAGQPGFEALPFPLAARFTASLAIGTGTLVAIGLLWMGGRAVARRAGASGWSGGLHGAKIAVPYALISLAGTAGVRFPVPVGPGTLSIHPSYPAAVGWPLGLGALFGFLGGFGPLREESWPSTAWGRRMRGAVVGGAWMIALGLIFSFAGLLLLAAVKPAATRAYFDGAFEGGTLDGVLAIALNSLVVPNMAAWVLFPAMGTCLSASGSSAGVGFSFCFLSWSHFPSRAGFARLSGGGLAGLTPGLPAPPPGYFAFILVPALAVVVGGLLASRRSRPDSRMEAAGIGALAGVVFAVAASLTLALALVTAGAKGSVGGISQSVILRLGPELVPGVLLALAWGLVGGALGGLLGARRVPGRAVPTSHWPAEPSGS